MEWDASEEQHATNVDIYKEILRQHGTPLHARDILERFQSGYGRELQGKTKPVEQIRSALQNSKWFTNLGYNTWWLVDEPPIETPENEDTLTS